MEEPYNDWANGPTKEEPVKGPIVSKWAKDAPGTHQAPDDRGVEEDSVARACPGAVSW